MPGIILLTRNFPPLRGGMERLNFHIFRELGKDYEAYLVGPKGAEDFCEDPSRVSTSPPLPVWRFLLGSFLQCLRLAVRRRPVLIVAGSGVAALPAVLAGRLAGIPVVTYLHGLDIIAPHPLYQRIFLPAIRRSQGWWVNSLNTRKLAVEAGMAEGKIKVLHPGTDLPDLTRCDGGKVFRERIGAGDRPILLSVGRLTKRKGLLEFVERALPEIVGRRPEVLLLIIGGEAVHSVAGASGGGELLRSRIAELGLEGNLLFLGEVDDRTLSEAFLASRVHVFPVLDLPGDVEGFGMVAIEAAAHGLPTVAFAVGGVPDAVEDGVSGRLIAPGDYQAMTDAIVEMLSPPPENASVLCRQHAERFGWEHFGHTLRALVLDALSSRPGFAGMI